MKRKMKRLIGLFAVAALVCALATTAFALNIDAGTINKTVGESGVYYRLPRLTDICVCGNVLREFIPDADDYTNMRYTVSGDGVSDVQMSVGTWPSGEYAGYPCMKVTYKVVKASNTTVNLSFNYGYYVSGEIGYCNRCGRRVSCPANRNTYTDTITFKVVGEDPVSVSPSNAPVSPSVAPVSPSVAPVSPSVAPVSPSIAPVSPSVAPVSPSVEPVVPTEVPPQVFPTPTTKVEETVEPTDEPTDEPIDEPADEPIDEPADEPIDGDDGETGDDENNNIPRTGDPTQFAFAIVLALTGIAVVAFALRRAEKR